MPRIYSWLHLWENVQSCIYRDFAPSPVSAFSKKSTIESDRTGCVIRDHERKETYGMDQRPVIVSGRVKGLMGMGMHLNVNALSTTSKFKPKVCQPPVIN